MDVGPALVADVQPSEAMQPSEAALDDPAVAAQALARLDALARDARPDVALGQVVSVMTGLIRLIRMQLGRPAAGSPAWLSDRLDGLQHQRQAGPLVHVGGGELVRERDTLAVDHQVVFGAWFAPIGGVRTGGRPPFFARTLELSMLARDQSIRSWVPRRSSRTRCSRCHTPACCQACKRRQQVIPLPQPISAGSHSHGIPVRNTNRMPASTARSGSRGRPPCGLGGSGGRSGSTTSHNSSLTSGFAIPPVYQTTGAGIVRRSYGGLPVNSWRRRTASRMAARWSGSRCIAPCTTPCPMNSQSASRIARASGS